MTLSALPDHLNPEKNPDAWKGTDQEVWYKKGWIKFRLKWLTFGPRATEWWAKFREYPITLIGIRGKGFWRLESTDGSYQEPTSIKTIKNIDWAESPNATYLSRIQPWCRYAAYLNWPLFFHFHIFWIEKAMMIPVDTNSDRLNILKYFEVSFGFKRDGDKVYFLTAFVGGRTE